MEVVLSYIAYCGIEQYRINRNMVTRYYRDMFLSMDRWIDMSLEELVVLEAECKMMLPFHMDKVG